MRALISLPNDGSNPAAASMSFSRACFAVAQSQTMGEPIDKHLRANDDISKEIITRATTGLSTVASVGFTSVADSALRAFLIDLEPYSGAARLIAQAVPAYVSPNREYPENYPVRSGGVISAGFIGEGADIPVIASGLSMIEIGPTKKMAQIIVWSKELGKRKDAKQIFEQMLREDVAAGIDAIFFATTAASASAPAGLLNGVTPLSGFGGGDVMSVKNDLMALSDAVASDGSGSVTYIVSPLRLNRFRILAPELAATIDMVASAVVPDSRIIAVDGRSLLVAIDPEPDILLAKHAAIHMSDTPLPLVSGAGTVAAPIRSLWQTASESFRIIHEIDFKKRRAGAVAYLENAIW